jgi:hypothetical protein
VHQGLDSDLSLAKLKVNAVGPLAPIGIVIVSLSSFFVNGLEQAQRTAKTDVNLIDRRLKSAKADYEVRYGKASQKG